MTGKPTLAEIAAMPFPQSVEAMRRYYNPHWGKPVPEGGKMRTYRVRVEYTIRLEERDTAEVEAFTDEEAEELAIEEVARDHDPWDDFKFERCKIVSIDGAPA